MANNQNSLPVIVIDDGSQPAIKVAVKDAKIIVATFTHFLLRNIGKFFINTKPKQFTFRNNIFIFSLALRWFGNVSRQAGALFQRAERCSQKAPSRQVIFENNTREYY